MEGLIHEGAYFRNFPVTCLKEYASCDPSLSKQEKKVNTEKQKVYTAILSDYWFLSKHCRLTFFSWASVPILDFLLLLNSH